MTQAEKGIAELMESVDTTIVIPNEKLLAVAENAGFFESFRIADDILRQGVQGISDIITIPGIINRDFADVKTIMARHGLRGDGHGDGERAESHDGRGAAGDCFSAARGRGDRWSARHSDQHYGLGFTEAGRGAAGLHHHPERGA